MKTLILATAAVLTLGIGSAFADGDGPIANTRFTELLGVVPQASVQAPSAVALSQQGAGTMAYVTSQRHVVSVFPITENEGTGG